MYTRIRDYINAVIKETILTLVIAIFSHYTCTDNVLLEYIDCFVTSFQYYFLYKLVC